MGILKFDIFLYRMIASVVLLCLHVNSYPDSQYSIEVIANNDVVTFYENRPFAIPVLENDFGLLAGVRSLSVSVAPKNGSCVVLEGNYIQYMPNRNFVGLDVFKYRVCSNSGECSEATVSVEIRDYDYQPTLVGDSLVVIAGIDNIQINILNNDLNIFDEPLELSLIGEVIDGRVSLNSDNTISVMFKQYVYGVDSIQYSLCDAEGDCDTTWIFFDVKSKYNKDNMFIPTGFSPNGDGKNDFFYIPDLRSQTQLSLNVFSQWGQLVYDDDSYNNKWDGMSNVGSTKGALLPTGNYYYVLTVVGSDIKLAGFIYLSNKM